MFFFLTLIFLNVDPTLRFNAFQLAAAFQSILNGKEQRPASVISSNIWFKRFWSRGSRSNAVAAATPKTKWRCTGTNKFPD